MNHIESLTTRYSSMCNIPMIRICEIDIFIRIRKTFTNVHKHIGIRKDSKLIQVRNLFTFLSLRFFDMRRGWHNFFLCWIFHLTPKIAAPYSLFRSLNLNLLFFFKFQNPQCFRVWHHSRPRSISYLFFFIVTSLIVISAPRAREHLHSMCAPN